MSSALGADASGFDVTMQIDVDKSLGPLQRIWRFFGADEPNYATMKDGEKLLTELGRLKPGSVYFRTHNLLTSGDGTPALKWGSTNAYTEDAQGHPIYNWTIVDHIFDTYLARGVRPYVEIGFMPQALSVQPDPYRQDWRPGFKYEAIHGGWAFPPRDYSKWGELVYQWIRHCVERYGSKEVEQWYFETWNEANYPAYWYGTADEFYKLHDYAIASVRRALPTARVGGPDSAGSGGKFMDDFLTHVTRGTNAVTGSTGTPADFLSFHAKGSATFIEGHVQLNLGTHLRTIDEGFAKIAAVPELRNRPIVIGESDPEACAACQGPQLAYRNSTMYSSYTAASFVRKQDLASRHQVNLEGALTWAFEFEDQRYFAGFRALASNGLDLPVLNVFRMFSLMNGDRIQASSSGALPLEQILTGSVRTQPDVGTFASSDGKHIYIMAWHYHDDDVTGPDARIHLSARGLDRQVKQMQLTHYRIDQNYSNSYAAWQRIGSPLVLSEDQYAQIEKSGQLTAMSPQSAVKADHGSITLDFTLPRQAVSLLVLEARR
ncbi:MAG: GH39 family glycosyl hydrolase [Povalibacter sp.]